MIIGREFFWMLLQYLKSEYLGTIPCSILLLAMYKYMDFVMLHHRPMLLYCTYVQVTLMEMLRLD